MDDKMIGFCGYDCGICAARSDDIELRRKMVESWKKLYGHTSYTEDNIPIAQPCAGCRGIGEIADKSCQARPCASSKGLDSCADCIDFPCDKVTHLLGDVNGLLLYCCRGKYVTREEFELGARQFCSMPNLVNRMRANGKLSKWDNE